MNPIPLVLASSNDHKIQEIHQILGSEFSLQGLREFGILEEIEENGNSFRENSLIKAQYVFQKTGLNVFSDDSGLEINALGGEPGIYSARYSGTRDMRKNLQKVLDKMEDQSDRSARFICVITLIYKGEIHFFEGILDGKILLEEKGDGGFGYDPIFLPRTYSQSFAEMEPELKNRISHRSLALNQMKSFLLRQY